MKQDFSYLWNDMSFEERKRLIPYSIQCHIRHVEQAKRLAVLAHRSHMNEINNLISSLKDSLKKEASNAGE